MNRHNNIKLEYLDDLSGLLNRRYWRREGKALVNSLISAGTPFTLAIVDIDHFKEINDTHGHMKGDEVIANFGIFLKENMRVLFSP